MIHDVVGLPSFTVVGLEETGPAATAFEWVPKLCARLVRATQDLDAPLDIQGSWGLMSDTKEFLAPWTEQGRYLAGWQVPRGTTVPPGWDAWTVPASSWLRIGLRLDQYQEALAFVHRQFLSEGPWEQAGAIQEHYPREFRDPDTDLFQLFVPLMPKDSPTLD